jgi:RNA polymerase II C-terminal domain phosphatase-like 3/4
MCFSLTHSPFTLPRYMYFPGSKQQFGLDGKALFEMGHDERAYDGMLASAARVIEQVHGDFFRELAVHRRADRVDARDILQRIQRGILRGVRIVFSRVYPVS